MTGDAYARNSDPDTSHEAADSLSDDALSRLQQKVVGVLLLAGAGGITVPEIADRLGIPRDTISPRIKPLVAKGIVIDTGLKTRPPGHSRMCIVWRLK